MPLLIQEDQVKQLLSMSQAVELVQDALRALGEGRAENRPRQRVRGEAGVLHVMPASFAPFGYMGFKAYTAHHNKAQFYFHLFSARTGEYLAIIAADRLGQIRTGAASGVATKYLAREDARTLGIIGVGWQAESQLEAVCAVRSIRAARCYARDDKRRRAFADKLGPQLGLQIEPVDDPRQAVLDSDIVVTATSSAEPVLSGDWLAEGTHLNVIGSNWAQRREVDDQTIRRSNAIFVDSLEQAKMEAGDLIMAAQAGALNWERVRELGALLAGKATGRKQPDEITLFKSIGLAIEDVAVGGWVYEQAQKAGIGRQIEL